jgi:hypothetical protein
MPYSIEGLCSVEKSSRVETFNEGYASTYVLVVMMMMMMRRRRRSRRRRISYR